MQHSVFVHLSPFVISVLFLNGFCTLFIWWQGCKNTGIYIGVCGTVGTADIPVT